MVSVRAPLNAPYGAAEFCRGFGGDGRAGPRYLRGVLRERVALGETRVDHGAVPLLEGMVSRGSAATSQGHSRRTGSPGGVSGAAGGGADGSAPAASVAAGGSGAFCSPLSWGGPAGGASA